MVVGVKKSIYPQNSMSINALYAEYVRIAVEKYHAEKQAKLKFETRVEADASLQELKQNSIVSIVFSAMCIESFLNEYASACIGDSEFYGSFDALPHRDRKRIGKGTYSNHRNSLENYDAGGEIR